MSEAPSIAPPCRTPSDSTRPAAVFGTIDHNDGQPMLQGDPATPGFWPVREYAEHLGALQEGDRVAGTLLEGSTVIVTSKLIPAGSDAPALVDELDNGALLFNAPHGLVLQSGNSRIELQPDGTVLIDGEDIHTLARHRYQLKSARVDLN